MNKITIALLTLGFASPLFAGVAKSDGSKFTAVAAASVEATCGTNFVFRDEHKNQVPAYLEPEVIKQSFKGTKFFVNLADAQAAANAGSKCIWFADSEKGALGL
ncbi:hypothetical protein N9W41_01255 [bacterium]|nr:hypothetical protein [bacterium]